jgi:hypothetical protein
LITVLGIGPIVSSAMVATIGTGDAFSKGRDFSVALTFASAIDDPARFTSSKEVGAYFGLTPTKYQKEHSSGWGNQLNQHDRWTVTINYENRKTKFGRKLKIRHALSPITGPCR